MKDKIGNVENMSHKGQGNAFEGFRILLGENHNLQSSFVTGAVLNSQCRDSAAVQRLPFLLQTRVKEENRIRRYLSKGFRMPFRRS